MTLCQQKVIDSFSECGTESSLFFCLIFKEYLINCPLKCPYFSDGSYYSINFFYQLKMEIECPYFYLITRNSQNPNDQSFFVCGVTGEAPDCDNCPLD